LRLGLALVLRQSHPLPNDLSALLVFRFHVAPSCMCNKLRSPTRRRRQARPPRLGRAEQCLSGEGHAPVINSAVCCCFCAESARFSREALRRPRVTHRASIVEEFPLQLSGQSPPLHDQGRSETSQNMLLFLREAKSGRALWTYHAPSGFVGQAVTFRLPICEVSRADNPARRETFHRLRVRP
jgi:hypothetical protein